MLGFSSRIADFSSPLASEGNAGHMILMPPVYTNHGSGLIEWKFDARTPPPLGPRRTTGNGTPAR